MNKAFYTLLVILFWVLASFCIPIFAAPLTIPGWDIIKTPSIAVDVGWWTPESVILTLWFKVLAFLKLFISGLALIYLVLIGVYMIVFSENEERIKSQRKQITYSLIGFLFLNIPWAILSIFRPEDRWGWVVDMTSSYSSTSGRSILWGNLLEDDSTLGQLILFLRVFIFWIAVLMFTWWLFRMIVSAGDDEARKQGRNRIIYGIIALLFLGFIKWWSTFIANADFDSENGFRLLWSKLFGVAIFFAAPVAIFFLILWAYYYITSGGSDERIKKGKAILMNTLIASIILIASLSFLTDIVNFNI